MNWTTKGARPDPISTENDAIGGVGVGDGVGVEVGSGVGSLCGVGVGVGVATWVTGSGVARWVDEPSPQDAAIVDVIPNRPMTSSVFNRFASKCDQGVTKASRFGADYII